jgi:hypothetical protein
LGGPGSVRVGGDAEDVDVAGADFHREEAVQTAQCGRAGDVEEVHGSGVVTRPMEASAAGAGDVADECHRLVQREVLGHDLLAVNAQQVTGQVPAAHLLGAEAEDRL